MVGEVDTVSPTFSVLRGGMFWLGGFVIIFLTIVVIASLLDSSNLNTSNRTEAGVPLRRSGSDDEPSMGLTPETAAPPAVTN